MNWLLDALARLLGRLLPNRLFRRTPWVPSDQRNEEGEYADWADPDCPDYRPDLTREQRVQAAAEYRAFRERTGKWRV